MARSVKADELSSSKAVSVALQVGYKKLKHKQNKAVKEFAGSGNVFVSLPTGSGKSSCYAVLPAAVNVKFPLCTTVWQVFVRQTVQGCSLHIDMVVYIIHKIM